MTLEQCDDVLLTAAVEVPYQRHAPSDSTGDLLARAFAAALDDSGFSAKDIDGLGVASFTLALTMRSTLRGGSGSARAGVWTIVTVEQARSTCCSTRYARFSMVTRR